MAGRTLAETVRERFFPKKTPDSTEVMRQVRSSLANGMTEEELNRLRNLRVAPGWTVGLLIEANLDFSSIEWKEVDGKRVLIKR
jgi:hypothetical protein